MTPTLKFAVVREDPELESSLVTRTGRPARCSPWPRGGCTALALLARAPGPRGHGLRPQPHPARPCAREGTTRPRPRPARAQRRATTTPAGSTSAASSRGLFRVLRRFLDEFVIEARRGRAVLRRQRLLRRDRRALDQPPLLARGLRRGLRRGIPPRHVRPPPPRSTRRRAHTRDTFSGPSRGGCAVMTGPTIPFCSTCSWGGTSAPPPYTPLPDAAHLTLVHGSLADVRELGRFDVISLSNIFDWSDDALVAAWAAHLAAHAKPGAHVLLRQLNNTRDLRRHFAPAFTFDDRPRRGPPRAGPQPLLQPHRGGRSCLSWCSATPPGSRATPPRCARWSAR
jgi:S-adenosylmethionine-diacylglycerol 3-amino-3-carboxypropyl transferase